MRDGGGGRLSIVAECKGAYWDSICSLRSAYRRCAAVEESACMLVGRLLASGVNKKRTGIRRAFMSFRVLKRYSS